MASFSYENRKGSGRKLKVHFDLPEDEDYPIDPTKMKHSSSSISSQSSLDSDDSDKDKENCEEPNNGGYGSPVWSFQGGSLTHSPPLQLMNPSPSPNSGYDPNRIPSSAFGPKPVSPMEWSVASNESLFSLHFGNNSFSREQFLAFRKSDELSKTNDLNGTSPTLNPAQEVNRSNDDNEVDNERSSLSSDSSQDSTDTSNKTTNVSSKMDDIISSNVEEIKLDETHDNHSKGTTVPNEEPKNYATNVSYRSVESDMSNSSFQFHILTPEGVRTSSETIEPEKKENNEKQQQKAIEKSHSPKSETKSKQRVRGWRYCSCFSCSPCY